MHIYKRNSIEEINSILDLYIKKIITKDEVLRTLECKERMFYYLLSRHKRNELADYGSYHLSSNKTGGGKVPDYVEKAIREELDREKKIIENKDIPTSTYNYSHIQNEVVRRLKVNVSYESVRRKAHKWGYVVRKYTKDKNKHTRQVLTDSIGVLLQHDSSHHLFSPLAKEKWYLITTIDDYSRMLLYAKLVPVETTWEHILAVKDVVKKYGIPNHYYVDNHSIFRYVKFRESFWKTKRGEHSEAITQWKTVLQDLGIKPIYALSPQAKGKIERPYRWLQDRLVRKCSKYNITTIEKAQKVLDEEIDWYNQKAVHSTTGEIPIIRFKRALKEGKSVFKKYQIPKPYKREEDIFSLREVRKVNGYKSIMWRNGYIRIEKVPVKEEVILHIIPDKVNPMLRVWWKKELVAQIFLGSRRSRIKHEKSI